MIPVVNAELAYVFRHALLRDAAYQLQLPGDRARLHALALTLIELLSGGRPGEVETAVGSDTRFQAHPSDPFAEELACRDCGRPGEGRCPPAGGMAGVRVGEDRGRGAVASRCDRPRPEFRGPECRGQSPGQPCGAVPRDGAHRRSGASVPARPRDPGNNREQAHRRNSPLRTVEDPFGPGPSGGGEGRLEPRACSPPGTGRRDSAGKGNGRHEERVRCCRCPPVRCRPGLKRDYSPAAESFLLPS